MLFLLAGYPPPLSAALSPVQLCILTSLLFLCFHQGLSHFCVCPSFFFCATLLSPSVFACLSLLLCLSLLALLLETEQFLWDVGWAILCDTLMAPKGNFALTHEHIRSLLCHYAFLVMLKFFIWALSLLTIINKVTELRILQGGRQKTGITK